MTTTTSSPLVNLQWTKILPDKDPSHPVGIPCTRSSHGVSLVQSNTKLVIYGGETIARTPLEDDQAMWICDLKETENSQWKWIGNGSSSSSTTPPPRVAHAQAVHKDRYVYIFGGRAGITMEEKAMNDLWVFDVETESWTECTSMKGDIPEARSFHQMLCVGDDTLWVFGGCSAHHGRLADLHKFDIPTQTWTSFGTSQHLRGRGGATLLPFQNQSSVGVIAGFAGEETNDGHLFDIPTQKWKDESLTQQLSGLRPRSVCVGGSFPSVGYSVIFGGEVDPSTKGHEGAGGFANDLVLLDEASGKYLTSISKDDNNATTKDWPGVRGWSSAASYDAQDGQGQLVVFGGLAGDDTTPLRLNDLWRLDISKRT